KNGSFQNLSNKFTWKDVQKESEKKKWKGVPLFIKSKSVEFYHFFKKEFRLVIHKGMVTTCSFGKPHYSIHASKAEVQGKKEKKIITLHSMTFQIKNSPLFYLPYFYWDTTWNPFVPSIRLGSTSQFGGFALLKWNLPQGILPGKETFLLDYFQKRGVGTGLMAEFGKPRYRWEDKPDKRAFYGRADGYFIHDQAENKQDRSGFIFPRKDRYWIKWLHMERLPGDILFTGEYQRYSDNGLQLEYKEKEAKEDKGVENYVYFQKNMDAFGFTALIKARLQNPDEEVEKLPQLTWESFSIPLFPLFNKPVYFDFKGELSFLRHFQPLRFKSDRESGRLDQKISLFSSQRLGFLVIRPFWEGRFTGYTKNVQGKKDYRILFASGGSLSSHFWRIYSLPFLSFSKWKHTITPEIGFESIYYNSLDPSKILQFDEVDSIRKGDSFTYHLRNRLLARTSKVSETYRVLEIHLFGRFFPKRKENFEILNKEWGLLRGEFYLNPGTILFDKKGWSPISQLGITFVGDFQYHPYQGKITVFNLGLQIQEQNRWNFLLSYRFHRKTSEALTFDLRIKWSQKWTGRFYYQYDLRQKRLIQQSYQLGRKLHQWYLLIGFETDQGLKDTRFTFNLAPLFMGTMEKTFGFEHSIGYSGELYRLPGS
ncbi:MAG: hypothetical protein D6785_01090, partial [Planctomycetota bacterium]